jgi:ubiquinone/menaquinone biosynthesis C-methylase UbiE
MQDRNSDALQARNNDRANSRRTGRHSDNKAVHGRSSAHGHSNRLGRANSTHVRDKAVVVDRNNVQGRSGHGHSPVQYRNELVRSVNAKQPYRFEKQTCLPMHGPDRIRYEERRRLIVWTIIMATSDTLFAGSIPDMYDRLLVPLIFEPYARDLAKRVTGTRPQLVLETAAGTGAVTRALASSLTNTRIVATDLNQPMLDHAKARQSGNGRIEWKQADAMALPFEDRTFDVVACQFGAMFFPDKVRCYREALRVLKPNGHFLFNVWDRISENEFADVVTQALALFFPQDPPRFLARTPHGYCDTDRIREELNTAGFSDVSIEAVDARSKASSPRDVAVAFCQGTPLRNEIEARGGASLEDATQHATNALAERFGAATIDGRMRAIVMMATREVSVQSKPDLRDKSGAAPV